MKLKYYDECRLNLAWFKGDEMIGAFESDPQTVEAVITLLEEKQYKWKVLDFDGGLKRSGRPLTRKQVQSLAKQQGKQE